jgi:hypothetical protein
VRSFNDSFSPSFRNVNSKNPRAIEYSEELAPGQILNLSIIDFDEFPLHFFESDGTVASRHNRSEKI